MAVQILYEAEGERTVVLCLIWKSQFNKRLVEHALVADAYLLTVQVSPTVFVGPKKFLTAAFVHYAQQYFLAVAQGNAYAIRRAVVNIIARSVQGVHHPTVFLFFQRTGPFFGNKTGFGEQFMQSLHDTFFRCFVHVRHIVMRRFLLHTATVERKPFLF